jgi:tryptophan synthase alpha chain
MNRLVQRFDKLRGEKRPALVAYLTAGDPSLDETAALVLEVARAGADVIELGVPFSDPSADGPVIQAAMERALSTGGAGRDTIGRVLAVVKQIRAQTDVPIVLFGYYNPILQRGLTRVAKEAADAGADGLLVVDLPPEESEELDAALAANQLVRVPLLAPTTTPERARAIVKRGGGFAYYVALTGVTGAGHLDPADVEQRTRALRPALGNLPLAVGFGIKDAAGARAIAGLAEGVVVGSALVKTIADAPDAKTRLSAAARLTRTLAEAITSAQTRAKAGG